MPEIRKCSSCGAELAADAPSPLCPRCLATAGTGPEGTIVVSLPLSEQPGCRIGRYKLLQEFGEGAFGVVYMAEQQEPVRRRIALKVIKLGMDTKEVVARFEVERQALALMDHPNIAKVLDAGTTESGRPYFVMELVKGERITEYCDKNSLTFPQRLDLFIQICRAIQHAHQKGIIHRDIKPSNILVAMEDGKPVPKVIDFGLAKAMAHRLTEKTLFTALGDFIGTPAYMSPEQADNTALDIDTRSDIYSLGVLLYELLAGKTPFDQKDLMAKGVEEMRRAIREEEPRRPSSRLASMGEEDLKATAKNRQSDPTKLVHLVRGDLDWIVMKCLEKDRTRRYETANGLAFDIQRHLNNEAVLARPPSKVYRFQKLVRRHKTAFAAAALMAAVLVAATAMSTREAIMAKRRQAEAEAISQFLKEVFQSPDPARDGRTITVAETLGGAAKKLETDLAKQPARRAEIQATLADTYAALGLYREAIPLQEEVQAYDLRVFGSEHTNTLSAMEDLAYYYYAAGRRGEAIKLREEVLPVCRKVNGPEHPDTLRAMRSLANSYVAAGRLDEALKLRVEVLALRRKVLGPEHRDTLTSMHDLGDSYNLAGRQDEAFELRKETLALRLKVLGPKHPETLGTMLSLATSYQLLGRRDEALKLREELLPIFREVFGPEHPKTLLAMQQLATSYQQDARWVQVLKLREEALTISRKVLGPEHPDTLMTMIMLGNAYDRAGRREDAIKLREEVVQLSRKLNGSEHPVTIAAIINLGVSYQRADQLDKALKVREEALPLSRKVFGPEHTNTLTAMRDLATSYAKAGRLKESIKLREEALPLCRKVLGPEHPETIGVMHNLAICYGDTGRWNESFKMSEEALPLYRKVLGPEHVMSLWAMHQLAISSAAVGRLDQAIKLREELLPLRRKVNGPEDRETLWLMNALAESYDEAGRGEEALKLREELLTVRRKVLGPKHPDTLAAMNSVAWTLATSKTTTLRHGTNAVRLAEEVVTMTSRTNASYLDTLAAAYAEAHQFDKAVTVQQEAMGLLHGEGEKKDYASRLKIYQSHGAYPDQASR